MGRCRLVHATGSELPLPTAFCRTEGHVLGDASAPPQRTMARYGTHYTLFRAHCPSILTGVHRSLGRCGRGGRCGPTVGTTLLACVVPPRLRWPRSRVLKDEEAGTNFGGEV